MLDARAARDPEAHRRRRRAPTSRASRPTTSTRPARPTRRDAGGRASAARRRAPSAPRARPARSPASRGPRARSRAPSRPRRTWRSRATTRSPPRRSPAGWPSSRRSTWPRSTPTSARTRTAPRSSSRIDLAARRRAVAGYDELTADEVQAVLVRGRRRPRQARSAPTSARTRTAPASSRPPSASSPPPSPPGRLRATRRGAAPVDGLCEQAHRSRGPRASDPCMTSNALTAFASDAERLLDDPHAIGTRLGALLAHDGWLAPEHRVAQPRPLPPAPAARLAVPAALDRRARVAARAAHADPRPRLVVRRRRLRGPRARDALPRRRGRRRAPPGAGGQRRRAPRPRRGHRARPSRTSTR